MTLQSCHSGLDPESSFFYLDSRFRGNDISRIIVKLLLKHYTSKVEVLPGLHKITVAVPCWKYGLLRHNYYNLKFNVEPGHEYQVKIKNGLFVVILDARSDKIIAKKLMVNTIERCRDNYKVFRPEEIYGNPSILAQREDSRIFSKALLSMIGRDWGAFGILMVSEQRLSFFIWDGDAFSSPFEFDYDKIASVKVKKPLIPGNIYMDVHLKNKDSYNNDRYFISLREEDKQHKTIELADFISKKILQK